MKCKRCGTSIVLYCEDNGAVHVLEKPKRGFIEAHNCGALKWKEILSKGMIQKLNLDSEE